MKTYIKPSIEVVETEVEQMVSLSTTTTGASSDLECLDKGYNSWNDGSSFWGE
ncbi:MAG: hypothetical protein LUC44_06260 [Prevotellaceae bacterium]|nr:hypothetical protein [Prevotellaceae bacterium]MCD8302606.1 hypothetical protein [Prevotellaceae bacterium]